MWWAGVETQGGNVAKGADHLAAVGATQCVAAVFYQPQVVFLAQRGHHVQVEGVAQRVRQHDGLGLGADGGLDLVGVNVVREAVHINKHWYCTELQDGVDGGGESRGHANDFIPLLDCAVAQLGRCERVERHQVGRRAGVDGDQVLDAEEGCKLFLEFGVEAAGGEPAVQAGFDHVLEF
jgi:hypothetical protein